MTLRSVGLALIFGLLNLLSFVAQSNDKGIHAFVLCRNDKAVRTIRVELDKKTSICRTVYSKAGVDQEVGSGKSLPSCVNVQKNIQRNLEAAFWKCREVDQAQLSSSKTNDALELEQQKKESN